MTLASILACSLMGTENGYRAPDAPKVIEELPEVDIPESKLKAKWRAPRVRGVPKAGQQYAEIAAVMQQLVDTTALELGDRLHIHVATVRAVLAALETEGKVERFMIPKCRAHLWRKVKQ